MTVLKSDEMNRERDAGIARQGAPVHASAGWLHKRGGGL